MPKNFLFVDDDSDDTELFCEALTAVDATVECHYVSNGKMALAKLEEIGEPGVIFMDLNMPEMSGLECLSVLKETTPYKDVPVLMYSTSANKQDTTAAKQLGALCFVTKPNEFDHLKRIIKTVITHVNSGNLGGLCEEICKNKDGHCIGIQVPTLQKKPA